MTGDHLLIVGGGIAGLRTAEAARAQGFTGPITLAGAEAHLPYDRPPLSKAVLAGDMQQALAVPRDEAGYAELNIDVLLGAEAQSLDLVSRTVTFGDGRQVTYDRLVIATGARARELPFATPDGVYGIRTLEDSLAIAARLPHIEQVAVIGGGFIGAEVAATARQLGRQVTIIEAAPVPLTRALGEVMGANCAALHEANGVTVLTSRTVAGFTGTDQVSGVLLEDGDVVPAQLVVVGVGAIPNTEWLHSSGLTIDNGVLCDATGQADSEGRVFAVGDVASWWSEESGAHVRREHWTSAVDQARHVGSRIAGDTAPAAPGIPYFWSDQHGTKIQMVGSTAAGAQVHVLHGSLAAARFLAVYVLDDRVVGALSFGEPRLLARYRRLVADRAGLSAALLMADQLDPQPARTAGAVTATA